jgi:MFS family permease
VTEQKLARLVLRVKMRADIGIATSSAFIIGPSVGGYLSQIDLRLPAFISTAIFLTNSVLIALFLPSSKQLSAEHAHLASTDKKTDESVRARAASEIGPSMRVVVYRTLVSEPIAFVASLRRAVSTPLVA